MQWTAASLARIASAFLPLILASCAVSLDMASHHPAHPINESVELTVHASGKVDRIELWVREYSIAIDNTLSDTAPATLLKTCNPAFWKSNLTCKATQAMNSDHALIEFDARAFAPGGGMESEVYRFASGAYHRTAPDLPFVEDPIPIRLHSNDTVTSLDIVMIPDPGLKIAGADPFVFFRSELSNVIAMYFQYEEIRKARGLFNFYYSTYEGEFDDSGSDCNWVEPSNMGTLLLKGDVVVFLHEDIKQDCREGAKVSSEIDYDKSLVHETAHGLFDIRDEREVPNSTYYPSQGDQVCQRNIWLTSIGGESKCQAEVPTGLEPTDCSYIIPPGQVWRIDPRDFDNGIGCIMGDHQHEDFSEFGPACTRRIDWRYQNCLTTECMAPCP